MNKMTEEEFRNKFRNLPSELKTIAQGKTYRNVSLKNSMVHGTKESGNSFSISISSLYEAYKNDDYSTTKALLKYVKGRNGAPAKAILDYVLNHNESCVCTTSKKIQSPTEVLNDKIKSKISQRDSDESYIIDLCDEVLQTKASRQHRFPFLKGDGSKPVSLPVDAYYEDLKMVIEYYELQHTESVSYFDKPETMTVSGVCRGEQRKIYDQRRREVLPQNGISLEIFDYSNFNYDSSRSKRLIRDYENDIKVVREKLKKYLKN